MNQPFQRRTWRTSINTKLIVSHRDRECFFLFLNPFPTSINCITQQVLSRDNWLLAYASVALNFKRNALFLNNYIPEHKILFKPFVSVQKRLKGSKNATLCVLLNKQSCRTTEFLHIENSTLLLKSKNNTTDIQCHSIHCSQERSSLLICSLSTIPLSHY